MRLQPYLKPLLLGAMMSAAAIVSATAGRTPGMPTDDRGVPLSLSPSPERLVLLSPSVVEMAFALGAHDLIVGVSRYSRWPAAARSLPQVGGGMDPDPEAILRLKPDLIISSGSRTPPALQRLELLGIPLALINHHSLDKVFNDFLRLGQWVGKADAAKGIVERLEGERLEIQARVSDQPGSAPSVVILYGFSELLSAGGDTFASDLVNVAGGRNLVDSLNIRWPMLNEEQLLKWNPDVIVFSLNGGETFEDIQRGLHQFAEDPRWSNLKAVSAGRLHTIGDSLLAIPGPRSLQAARALFSIFYPAPSAP